MGIINATPDSFFSGSRAVDAAAIDTGLQMLADGAEILDIGGESTRPGAEVVSEDEELQRVLPVVEALSEHGIVSIDSRNPEVARQAVHAGATIINDISASLDHVAAETGAGWVAMHMLGAPATMQQAPRYANVVDEVLSYLETAAERASNRGVKQVWIDPGIGFGKTYAHNVALIGALDRFVDSGWPVLLGVSRKSFIGQRLAKTNGSEPGHVAPAADRLDGSVAMATWGFLHQVDIVRAHDVKETARCATVAHDALNKTGPT